MTILKADQGGCGFYRCDEPARVVNAAGLAQVTVATAIGCDADVDDTGRVTVVRDADLDDVDVLVIQRPTTQRMNALAQHTVARGVPLVVEIDDDFHNVHPRNVAHLRADPRRSPLENRTWLWETALLADVLTVSTPALMKYGRPGRARVVRNYVPDSILDLRRRTPRRRRAAIGWTGTIATHPGDLETTGGALSTVDCMPKTIGEPAGVAEALRVDEMRCLPWAPIRDYWQAIADEFDAGIVPLAASKFNRAKSWIKGLEFAALGVPFIASPTPEYRLLAGMLGLPTAATPGQWRRHLGWLADAVLLPGLDETMRRAVLGEQLTIEDHVGEWDAAWQAAITAQDAGAA